MLEEDAQRRAMFLNLLFVFIGATLSVSVILPIVNNRRVLDENEEGRAQAAYAASDTAT